MKRRPLTPDDARHGTPSGYVAGCRDDACTCRAAYNARNGAQRKQRKGGYAATVPTLTADHVEDILFLVSVGEDHVDNVARRIGPWPTADFEARLRLEKRGDILRALRGTPERDFEDAKEIVPRSQQRRMGRTAELVAA